MFTLNGIGKIACLIMAFTLLQSCIIYRKSPTIEKASSRRNTHIKIITKSGYKHKLRWIEEKDGSIYSITNTKRVYIPRSKLGGDRHNPGLIDVEDKGDYISGLKLTGKDTMRVIIPINDIETIKITSRGATYPVNFIGWGFFSVAAGYGLFVALWYLSDSAI